MTYSTLEEVFIDLTMRVRKNIWFNFICLSGSSNPIMNKGVRSSDQL